MSIFIVIACAFSLFVSVIKGTTEDVTQSILSSPQAAVELCFTLMGTMAFWGGVMRVAERSGLVAKIALIFKPILNRVFRDINPDGEAFGAIVMNISANMLGLGNAATPLGIKAVKELVKEQNANATATRSIITLVVINTASIQLLPTTIATIRQAHGSNHPMAILAPVLLTSAIALIIGLLAISLCDTFSKTKNKQGTGNE